MPDKKQETCSGDCLVRDVFRLYRTVERRMAAKLPTEVREPLEEAKKQGCLVLKGLIGCLEKSESIPTKNYSTKSRNINVE